jgi:hypothetical protein
MQILRQTSKYDKRDTTMPDEIDLDKNPQPSSNSKRMSVTLSQDAAAALEWMATEQGITQKEAIRKTIALEAYLCKERKAGSKILFYSSDGQVREVIFR